MDLNLSFGSNASAELRGSPREGEGDTPFRRSPHHLLQPEQQDELQRKWAKQKEYQRVLQQQIGERHAERLRTRQMQAEEEHAERSAMERAASPSSGTVNHAAGSDSLYDEWRIYNKTGHGRVSPEIRKGMEQQQYRSQQPQQQQPHGVQEVRDNVVNDASQQIEAMKSDVDRMLQQARREAAEKTSSEVEEVAREMRKEAERAIRDAVAREAKSTRAGSPLHSPVKPRPNFSVPNPAATESRGFSEVGQDLAATWAGPEPLSRAEPRGDDRLSQSFDGSSPQRSARPRSPLVGAVPLSNGVPGVPRRRGTFGEGGLSPEAEDEVRRKRREQKETAEALEAQIAERQRERQRTKREEEELERREQQEFEESLATRLAQEKEALDRRRTLSAERVGPEELGEGGSRRGQSPPPQSQKSWQGRGRSPSPHVVPRTPPRVSDANSRSTGTVPERPNFSVPNPATSAGNGARLLELSSEQWSKLEQLLSTQSPRRTSSNISPQMEAWCQEMETRVAAAENRIGTDREEIKEGLAELGRHQTEQANVLARMTEQLESMAEAVREVREQMSRHQLDQTSTVLASLTDVEEVAAEVQQRLRAEQERAKAITEGAVRKLEVTEKQLTGVARLQTGLQKQLEATAACVVQMQDDLDMPSQMRLKLPPAVSPPRPGSPPAARRSSPAGGKRGRSTTGPPALPSSMVESLKSSSDEREIQAVTAPLEQQQQQQQPRERSLSVGSYSSDGSGRLSPSAEEAVEAAVAAATDGVLGAENGAAPTPAREVIVMVEDSHNDGRITLASIHTGRAVLQLKEVVAAKLKIPVGSQRLFFGDTLLEDDDGSGKAKPLSEWGISTGSIVRLERVVA